MSPTTTMLLCIAAAGIVSGAGGTSAPAGAILLNDAPCYAQPGPGQLPVAFLDRGDPCTIDSVATDSTAQTWFRLGSPRPGRWIAATALRYVGDTTGTEIASPVRDDREARRRRYRMVRKHPEWPRRIRRAVREGAVCLGMSRAQLRASWGEPFQKGKAWTMGIGEYRSWFYRGENEQVVYVCLSEGRVVGWYLE